MLRVVPSGRIVSTVASSTRIATAMSLGCVAMQASLAPTTACCRLTPPMAAQPLPGRRLLQAQAVDVDQVRRCLDLEFHEVEQVGAARDELRARRAGRGDRLRGGCRAFVA